MTRQPDAFFVYGTLRPGQFNWRLIAPLVADTIPAVLRGHVLYGRGLLFPYAVPGRGHVVGDLLIVDPAGMPEALCALDELEGYEGEGRRNHYDRRPATVTTVRGLRRAWVYVAATPVVSLSPNHVIPTGDWLQVSAGWTGPFRAGCRS